ncbi:MAG: transposase [Candidatus Brocadia sp. WS118]|nr:MAG: transposase [Candidatus Brocadia sp. WS118]
MKRDKALSICGVSKHQYYYEPKGGKPGRQPSKYTFRRLEGKKLKVPNKEVAAYIRKLFDNPLAEYGYHRMAGELTLAGFYINHKKVYRLMKDARLLQPKRERASKDYVKYRVVCPEGPLRLMEMDIKTVWIEGLRRYAYVLTILDVPTRVALYWEAGFQMKQEQVQGAWAEVIENHLQPAGALGWETHIEVRSDNGPQFCAEKLRKFFKDNYLAHAFTHPYTPQENGHIESFHAILGRALEGQYFEDLPQLCGRLENFYDFYNRHRIHGSTVKLPPMVFAEQWELGNIERKVVDEKKRKVRLSLKIPRQEVRKACPEKRACLGVEPADNGSQREVSSLKLEGLDAPSISKNRQSGELACEPGKPALNVQPAA